MPPAPSAVRRRCRPRPGMRTARAARRRRRTSRRARRGAANRTAPPMTRVRRPRRPTRVSASSAAASSAAPRFVEFRCGAVGFGDRQVGADGLGDRHAAKRDARWPAGRSPTDRCPKPGSTATASRPASVSARATLTPLPPGSLVTEVTRCTAPRVSGESSVTVRSMLGLGVTVTIMRQHDLDSPLGELRCDRRR